MDGMSNTLSGLSDVIGSDLVDFDPVIAPVLDLSQVKKEASTLAEILSMPKFDLSATSSSAQNANNGFEENRDSTDVDLTATGSGDVYYYSQTNNSPKALSEIEIYRQTNNLISQTRSRKEGS